ncbi:uncharacterized protein VDAG_10355 [Verticillium dahliae VdLs.17]|uniref:Uncharacterized protein n=1 Tax=Verticillium dahliae (strain VdLs.17 / ATCC MYA-4575 / FGSC 10137) TaxID=498257 RepID=G2XJF4_VERDV|nr:uncharacterized protein VDAG_10355 [Verticillium dahliae VdLs.17]EGY20657.1 hypothetical protein VDAG_10355 [Verticillium dahliae VdLs.17]KAH6700023.1 hypothetical protein EV126DRAFT_476637 [Verticillium dahliae]
MANANQRHSQVSTGIQGLESMGSNNLERAFSRFRILLQRDLRGIRGLVHPTATRFVHFDRRAERSFDIWMNWIFDHLGLEPSQIRMDVNSGHLIVNNRVVAPPPIRLTSAEIDRLEHEVEGRIGGARHEECREQRDRRRPVAESFPSLERAVNDPPPATRNLPNPYSTRQAPVHIRHESSMTSFHRRPRGRYEFEDDTAECPPLRGSIGTAVDARPPPRPQVSRRLNQVERQGVQLGSSLNRSEGHPAPVNPSRLRSAVRNGPQASTRGGFSPYRPENRSATPEPVPGNGTGTTYAHEHGESVSARPQSRFLSAERHQPTAAPGFLPYRPEYRVVTPEPRASHPAGTTYRLEQEESLDPRPMSRFGVVSGPNSRPEASHRVRGSGRGEREAGSLRHSRNEASARSRD